MKKLLVIAVTSGVLFLSACGSEGQKATDVKPDPTESSSPAVVNVPKDAKPGEFPEFNEADYTFVYERSCFCPVTGAVEVTVKDGKAIEAHYVKKPNKSVLEYESITINDIIAQANEADEVDFKWPEGQAYPDSMALDNIKNAVDDEMYYTIVNVTVQ